MKEYLLPEFVIYHTGDDWAALYADGKLVIDKHGNPICGDSYHVDEYLQELLGIETIYDKAFLLGGNSRESCAETVEEIEEFIERREEARAEAARLRAQAERILAEAKVLEAGI